MLSRELLLVMATEKFYDAFRIVPWIVFGNIFLGIYYATAIGTNLKKKTQYQAIAVIAAATLNLLLNFVLIPEYGMMGAWHEAKVRLSALDKKKWRDLIEYNSKMTY